MSEIGGNLDPFSNRDSVNTRKAPGLAGLLKIVTTFAGTGVTLFTSIISHSHCAIIVACHNTGLYSSSQ